MHKTIFLMSKREDPFARVPKTTLDDEKLSWRAKGLLSYLIGKPMYWKVRVSDLINRSTDGQTAIRSALKELEDVGYAKLEKIQGPKGRIAEWVWKISDSPIFSPDSGSPHLDNPHLENPAHSKKDCSKNDLRSEESKGTSPAVDVVIPSTWKPSERDKGKLLRSLPVPEDYPGQDEFNDILDERTEYVPNYRPDLYDELCRNKWHEWNQKAGRWIPIRDWVAYVIALDKKIAENFQ